LRYSLLGFRPSLTLSGSATRVDIRNYLMEFRDYSPWTYANILKALRIFYRDYLGKPEVIEGFKFPNRPFGYHQRENFKSSTNS
jgi:hypothetical protein